MRLIGIKESRWELKTQSAIYRIEKVGIEGPIYFVWRQKGNEYLPMDHIAVEGSLSAKKIFDEIYNLGE